MRFFSETIETGRVDSSDTTFRISTPKAPEDLAASIRRHGLLCPPFLRKSETGGLIVVSGFRRIEACRLLGWEQMDVRIVAYDASDLECLGLAIADNALHRPLNAVEQSEAVSRLSSFFDDDRALCREAKQCGLQVNPDLVGKLRQVAALYPELHPPLMSGLLPLTIALELGTLDRQAAVMLLRLFEALKPTLNHQKEIFSLAREVALARRVPVLFIIQDAAAVIADDPNPDRFQKIQKIRTFLQRLRYPEISRFEKKFQERLARLELPDDIRLIAPVHFEGPDFVLSMTFQNIDQFQSGADFLVRLAHHPDLKKILDKASEDIPPVH